MNPKARMKNKPTARNRHFKDFRMFLIFLKLRIKIIKKKKVTITKLKRWEYKIKLIPIARIGHSFTSAKKTS
ncbi:hypothetical protein PPA04_16270 [Pediococcus parvulus]|nr:hypothetical protein PPA04_16270 [Pediococcus parvulus]GHC07886.1 hypothetical protein GCM10008912_09350 [Pediococcus parvulus]